MIGGQGQKQGDQSGGYYSNPDCRNHGGGDEGVIHQGVLKKEEPTEFPHGLGVWFEREKTQDGFKIVDRGAKQLENEVVIF